ncbi:DUF354 domain-containing protein, partial [candidate division KSB1 bacterium]|nr:DUF354 domain-containing protein [candidate division KSB1 bacterium]
LDFLKAKSNVLIVIIPRGEKQKQQFMNYKKSDAVWKEKLIIPDSAIDTLSLLYYADLMIGGGGTMNREAVALGVPTYSFFCGPIGDVDQYLKNTGRLHFIATEEDIFKIEIRKKSEKKINFSKNGKLKEFIIKEIEACL